MKKKVVGISIASLTALLIGLLGAFFCYIILSSKIDTRITIKVSDKVYDGQIVDLKVNTDNGVVPVISFLNLETNITYNETPKDAGTYQVNAVVDENFKYKRAESKKTFTISPKEVEIIWKAPSNLAYDGTPKVPQAQVKTGLIAGDSCDIIAIVNTGDNNVKVGEFSFVAIGSANKNYKLIGNLNSEVYTITKGVPNYIRPTGLTAFYGQTLADVELPQGFSWKLHTATGVGQVGINYFNVIYTPGDTENYNSVNNISVYITVTKRPREISVVNIEELSRVYGSTIVTPEIEYIGPGVATVVYKKQLDSDSRYNTSCPTNAGDYIAKISIPETEFYSSETLYVEFSIYKAVPLYSVPSNISARYGDNLLDVQLPTGFSWTMSSDYKLNRLGNYSTTVKYTPSDTLNYQSIDEIPVTVVVNKAVYDMSNVKWNYSKPFVYSGKDRTVYLTGLPEGVTVDSYTNNTQKEIGTYTTVVSLNYDTLYHMSPVIEPLTWQIIGGNVLDLVVTQTSQNYISDTLADVKISCSDNDYTLEWGDDSVIVKNAYEVFMIECSLNGEYVGLAEVEVKAIPKLDSSYVFQDMLFTLNTSTRKASVKANTDTIKQAIIPGRVEFNSIIYTVNKLEYKAFYNLPALTYAYIPDTITTYGGVAFAHSSSLKTVDLDKNLTNLGTQTFMYCSALENITIPKNVTKINTGVFSDCVALSKIEIPQNVTTIDGSVFARTNITSITLPEGLKTIGAHAFSSCKLEEVVIPKSVTLIENNAFSSSSQLKTIKILSENITIEEEAFYACRNLKNIFIDSESLVNSIVDNTAQTNNLLYNLSNKDVIHINNKITNITSPYINEMFTKITSEISGYNAYQLELYTLISVDKFSNRVYILNGELYGDETLRVRDPEGNIHTLALNEGQLEFFDTSSIGKKMAKLTYKFSTIKILYYVLPTLNDNSFDCISEVRNLNQNYYLGESLDLTSSQISYKKNINGYINSYIERITTSMVSGFSSSTLGSRILKIEFDNLDYEIKYNVQQKPTEKITSASFSTGIYYSQNTTEETEHFKINIAKGSYLPVGYKETIELIYQIEQEVSGLQFAPKITLNVDDTNYPSCSGTTLYLTSSNLFLVSSSTFMHELAHALDHSQAIGKSLPSSVLTEGFATYIEFLTAKKLYEEYPEIYVYSNTYRNVAEDCYQLKEAMYFYDLETKLLKLERDELVANSQYEIGARFFSYLNYRYGDFCGWMKGTAYRVSSIEAWAPLIKNYYNNSNVLSEMYEYYQSQGDKFYIYFEMNQINKINSHAAADVSSIHMLNYYFDFSIREEYQGYKSITYRDLYLNIDSARDQLTRCGKEFTELQLKSLSAVTVELYNSDGQLITTKQTTSQFSLAGVSFIKLVGVNSTSLYLTY